MEKGLKEIIEKGLKPRDSLPCRVYDPISIPRIPSILYGPESSPLANYKLGPIDYPGRVPPESWSYNLKIELKGPEWPIAKYKLRGPDDDDEDDDDDYEEEDEDDDDEDDENVVWTPDDEDDCGGGCGGCGRGCGK